MKFFGFSGVNGSNGLLRRLKPSTPNEAFLAGEGQGAAVEGEESPSDKQTEDPTGQSASGGYFGLEIDGSAVDTAVAVDRGDNGRVALVGGKG